MEGERRPAVAQRTHLPGVKLKPGVQIDGHRRFLPMPLPASRMCPQGKTATLKTEDGTVSFTYAAEECLVPDTVFPFTLEEILQCELYGGLIHPTKSSDILEISAKFRSQNYKELLNRDWILISPRNQSHVSRYILVRGFSRACGLWNALTHQDLPFSPYTNISVRLSYIDEQVFEEVLSSCHRVCAELKEYDVKQIQSRPAMLTVTGVYRMRRGDGKVRLEDEARLYNKYLDVVFDAETASKVLVKDRDTFFEDLRAEGFPKDLKPLYYAQACACLTREFLVKTTIDGLAKNPVRHIPSGNKTLNSIVRLSKMNDALVMKELSELVCKGDFQGKSWKSVLKKLSDQFDEDKKKALLVETKTKQPPKHARRKLPIKLHTQAFGGSDKVAVLNKDDIKDCHSVIIEQAMIDSVEGVAKAKELINVAGSVLILIDTMRCHKTWPPSLLGDDHCVNVLLCTVDGKNRGVAIFSRFHGLLLNDCLVPGESFEQLVQRLVKRGMSPAMLRTPRDTEKL